MKCPKCRDTEMVALPFCDLVIDRCLTCDGVWLDKGELETILSSNTAALIERVTLNPKAQPEEHDHLEGTCPRCNQEMVSLRGAGDIRFEWCMSCEGMFFDKGELKQLHECGDNDDDENTP